MFKVARPLESTVPAIPAFELEVWALEDIAEHLRMTKPSLYQLVNRHGFPTPIGNSYRNRRWLAKDVRSYFEGISKNLYRTKVTAHVEPSYQPSVITFKE